MSGRIEKGCLQKETDGTGMKIGSSEWNDVIFQGASFFEVCLSKDAVGLIVQHANELSRWNHKINLTAITDPFEMAVKHYVDAIALNGELKSQTAQPATLLDIGSGAGFPGMIVKILQPSLNVTLIDASRKKVSFLNHMIRTLKLRDIQALHLRAQGYAAMHPPCFDFVVCRAFSKVADFVDLALPFLSPGGKMIALKGAQVKDELTAVRSDSRVNVTGCRNYQLPFIPSQRTMVVLERRIL